MDKVLEEIDRIGKYVDENKKRIAVKSKKDISVIPATPGCYWIETTMPKDEIIIYVNKATNKNIKTRKRTPSSTNLIKQQNNGPYIVYNGTHGNIHGRINEHLFNGGHKNTGKLGFDISEHPLHKKYELAIYYFEISDPILRDTIEKWWRYKIGWPQFCIR